jgi:hypothetical protein
MDFLHKIDRMAGAFIGVPLLGLLLVAAIPQVQAGGSAALPANGRKQSSGTVQLESPPIAQPLFSPPAFIDRSPPVSERPFAKPFIDRGPSFADRPLAPIGGETQVAPGAMPFVWCQGQWMRADSAWNGCTSR